MSIIQRNMTASTITDEQLIEIGRGLVRLANDVGNPLSPALYRTYTEICKNLKKEQAHAILLGVLFELAHLIDDTKIQQLCQSKSQSE